MAKKDWNPILQAAPGVETPKKFQQFLDRGEAGKQAFKDAQEVKQILPKETGKFDTLQKVVDLLGLIPGPAAAGKAGMTAIMGAITPGGLRKLSLTHNTRVPNLEQILSDGYLEIPSFAVTKNNPPVGFGNITMVMNPRRLDPAINSRIHMTNRDAYTPDLRQFRQFFGSDYDVLNSRASRLLQQSEPGFVQDLAIRASPDFRGFKPYEKSPAGAATLDKPYTIGEDDIAAFLGVRPSDLHLVSSEAAFKEITGRAGKGDKKALQLLKDLKQTGSQYAEVKVLDKVPLHRDTVLGVVFPSDYRFSKPSTQDLMDALENQGIRAGGIGDLLPPAAVARRNALAEQRFKMGDEASLEDAYANVFESPSAMDEVLQSITSRAFK